MGESKGSLHDGLTCSFMSSVGYFALRSPEFSVIAQYVFFSPPPASTTVFDRLGQALGVTYASHIYIHAHKYTHRNR